MKISCENIQFENSRQRLHAQNFACKDTPTLFCFHFNVYCSSTLLFYMQLIKRPFTDKKDNNCQRVTHKTWFVKTHLHFSVLVRCQVVSSTSIACLYFFLGCFFQWQSTRILKQTTINELKYCSMHSHSILWPFKGKFVKTDTI